MFRPDGIPNLQTRNCERCGRLVIGYCFCDRNAERIEPIANVRSDNHVFHQLWKELHTKQDPTQEWWDGIVKKVSSYFCSCGDFLRGYIATSPPRFDDWFAWSWELHSAVNRKLNKPDMTLDEARAIWLPNEQP